MPNIREQIVTQRSTKGILLSLTALCLAGVAIWVGYVQFFTNGLESLPTKICDGSVDRGLATQVLPPARSAEEGVKRQNSGDDLTFYCHVDTSNDSSLWSEAKVQPLSKADWLESYGVGGGNNRIIHTSVDGIEAVAKLDTEHAAVYVSCSPPGVPSYNASEDYAVTTRVEANGDLNVTGTALRQVLTDFAYQVTKHTYELAECKEPRDFPDQLPRY
ncbi:hypothetical protein QF037_002850 [Streptomyces canus]|uniref:hypothetical protein n=1 Tax=Streptomyces canus TaxID=58343 RepID=UPI0027878213|nr:hypothetical protein [Streptomyces canus]MDQ0598505.1 hypothetical protein [Streptomyces canus]